MTTHSTLLARLGGEASDTALVFEGQAMSYGRLEARANQFAHALLDLGLRRGELFAFLLSNGPDILCAYIACARTGIVGLPVSQRITGPELLFQLADSKATVLLVGEDYSPIVDAERPQLGGLRHVLGQKFLDGIDRFDTAPLAVSLQAEAPFTVIYTGGTTGRSKAAIQTHRSWMCCLETTVEKWELTSADRQLISLPMSHAAWFTAGAALQSGGTVTIVRHWNPALVLELIEQQAITTLNMIPTMLNDLLAAHEAKPREVSSVRLITVAGSVLPIATYERARDLFGEVIGNIYGLTEAAGPVTFLLPSEMAAGKFDSVGLPGRYIEWAILDDDGIPIATDGRGELGLAGPQMTPGYLNNEEETAKAFAGKWFRTGDVAEVDADGYLSIVDRKKDMIKTGGFNVYPSEVEQVLYQHPDVLEGTVLGMPDAKWMEALHAFIVLKPGAACSMADLSAFCRTRLAGYKVPKAMHLVDKLPRTRFGKFDKVALKKALAEKQEIE